MGLASNARVDARLGATYEDVVGRGLGSYGESPLFYAQGGDPYNQFPIPGRLVGLQSFSLRPVPEPSIWALLSWAGWRWVDSAAPTQVNMKAKLVIGCVALNLLLSSTVFGQASFRLQNPLPGVWDRRSVFDAQDTPLAGPNYLPNCGEARALIPSAPGWTVEPSPNA